MKSNTKKRLIAFMLCMVLVLSSATSVFADEPQNTDSQSQTEAVAEPAADEATEDTTTEDTTTEDVSDTPDIEIPSKKEWSVQVGNATVKVNGSADALPADAQLSVTEITSEDEVKEIEKAVEEKAIEEQFSIKNIFSYDIKFLVNGSEVQPTTPVQVSVDTPEITSSENAAVLHVDDNNVAEDMKGAVDGEGKVVFDAPHFSKYVIVQKGNSKVNVTIEYYDDTQNPKTMIYASKKELSPGESINNYDIADNWNINWAEKSTTDGNFERISNLDAIQVVSDCTIKVYYTPQDKTITGSTTFYDYTVKAGKQNEIYYSFNQLKNDKSPDIVNNQKLIAGTNDSNVGQNYPEYQKYKISLKDSNNDTKDANCYTGGDSTIPGLLKEIDDNGNVIFNYAEPGFFVDSDYSVQFGGGETRNLRKVYKDYTLEFVRKGDTYTLNGVRNKNNGWVTGAGNNFYPLNSVKPSYEESETSNNYYFGMRYDVTFKIGDYVGPLNYKFTGDDDLWVVLDGKKIVIDLGGIHSAATGNVDLWQYIGDKENLTEAQKQQTHTLTILYMERGAGASNCQMEFTLPSAKIQQVDKTKMTNISFYKTDANGTGLSGAQFTLTNDSTKTTMYAAPESDGLVQFQQLVAGTYTLTETQAPNGYVTPTTSWKVKVTADRNNDLSAKIYQADGTTELGKLTSGGYQIINKKKDPEDKPFIEVTKTFKGLTKNQIRELAEASSPYTITLTHTETNTTKPLTMDVSELDSILRGSDDEKVWTYTWKLEDCLDGTYKVSESNYNKDGYDVTVTVNGQTVTDWNGFSVSTKKAEIGSYDPSGNSTTTCAPTEFQIGKVNLIVAQLTGNEGYFVWTRTPVSISERRVIVQLISYKKDGIGFSPEATLEKCYFYSGNGIKDTLVFRNGEIKYDGEDKLTFDASKQWTMFAAGTYTFKETQNAEIQITNTYSEQTADLDLIKTSVAGTKFDGAEFKLYKKNDKGVYELQKFEYTDESGKNQTRETIQVINTGGSEAELKNLQSGQYYLEEVKAPEACMLLADKIYFKQEKGKITLTDKDGKALSSELTMWTLSNTDGKYTLTVKNEILYSLPSAGGTGIYLYMIGGILLMFAAVWILYKNKRREVLKR